MSGRRPRWHRKRRFSDLIPVNSRAPPGHEIRHIRPRENPRFDEPGLADPAFATEVGVTLCSSQAAICRLKSVAPATDARLEFVATKTVSRIPRQHNRPAFFENWPLSLGEVAMKGNAPIGAQGIPSENPPFL